MWMDICCPRCGGVAEPAGHEDARAFYRCPTCARVWATHISSVTNRVVVRSRRAPRVLVADDSPEMLGLLAAWLEDEGCVVIAAGSGREALDAAAAYRPDIAFLDIVLPPPDGVQLCEVLTRRTGITIVLMTGFSHVDTARVRAAGALRLLPKPLTREAVIEALTAALEDCRRTLPPLETG